MKYYYIQDSATYLRVFNLILHNNLALFFTALYRGSYYKSSHTDDAKKERKSSFYSKSNLAAWLLVWIVPLLYVHIISLNRICIV